MGMLSRVGGTSLLGSELPLTPIRSPAGPRKPAFDAVYHADPAELAQIRDAVVHVARGCGADGRTLAKIKLAVSEAANNAVVHAYRDGVAAGHVYVLIHHEDEFLDVRVRDNGVGMSPRIDSPGAGLGLPLMASLADGCEIHSPRDGGTEVVLRFQITAR
jgi:anti-sigma regulatory factor (Ser/Thr protein kinase)